MEKKDFTTKLIMISRTPTENENRGDSLLDSSFPRTRESRFGLRPISLDTRFRGYDGTQVTPSLWETIALHVFSKEARRTRRFRMTKAPNFVLFVSFVVKISSH